MGTALEGFVGLALQTPGLNKILSRTFNAPSVASLLSKGHLPRIRIQPALDAAMPDDPTKWHLGPDAPLYELPWTVMVNDNPGLLLDAMVTGPQSPFLITGGLIYLRAVNPIEREKCLTLYLLGARRGGGAPTETPRVAHAAAPAQAAEANSKASSPYERVVLIGASVTHGFTSSELFGGEQTAQYDLSRYLDAALLVPHGPITNLGTSLFFMQPDSSGERQTQLVLEGKPTLVVGIDFLFWFCYGKAADEGARLEHFNSGLGLLNGIHAPLILGDIPDVSAASGGILSSDEIPKAETLLRVNRRLKEWASQHPAVVVVPLAKFMNAAAADEPVTVHGHTLRAGQTHALIQADKLHPTQRGCAMLALAILDAFQVNRPGEAGGDARWDPETVRSAALESILRERERP